MIRNPLYLYGNQNVYVPADMHLGRYVLDKFYDMKEDIALTNVEEGSSYTFGDIAQQAVAVSLSLARAGAARGTMVAVCSEPRAELISTILGILCSGATVVSIDGTFREGKKIFLDIVQGQLSSIKATILLISTKFYRKMKQVLEGQDQLKTIVVFEDQYEPGSRLISFKEFLTETAPVGNFIATPVNGAKDVALIGFSSGTTGLSKAIQLTHYNMLIYVNLYKYMKKGDRLLALMHWGSTFSVKFVLGAMSSGAQLFVAPHASITPGHQLDAAPFYNYIDQHKINVLQLSGAIASLMLAADKGRGQHKLSSLQMLICLALPLDMCRVQKLKRLFGVAVLRNFYGMSEVGPICSNDFTDESCNFDVFVDESKEECPKNKGDPASNINNFGLVSVGRPCPGITLKIVDLHSGVTLGANLLGEICVKTYGLCLGYYNQEMKIVDGWFHTGDAGCYDKDGWVYMFDRVTDLIHIGGSIVSPSALEAAVARFPGGGVRDAAVARRGGQLAAYVVVHPLHAATPPSERDLLAYIHNLDIEGAALIGSVQTVSRIPRSLFGKMDRRGLQDLE